MAQPARPDTCSRMVDVALVTGAEWTHVQFPGAGSRYSTDDAR